MTTEFRSRWRDFTPETPADATDKGDKTPSVSFVSGVPQVHRGGSEIQGPAFSSTADQVTIDQCREIVEGGMVTAPLSITRYMTVTDPQLALKGWLEQCACARRRASAIRHMRALIAAIHETQNDPHTSDSALRDSVSETEDGWGAA